MIAARLSSRIPRPRDPVARSNHLSGTNRAPTRYVSTISVFPFASIQEGGTRMCPGTRRMLVAALLATCLLCTGTPPGYAHGGGGGGGGGHGGGSHGGGGYHSSSSAGRGWGRGYGPDPTQWGSSSVGWPSFPEDLPFNKLHQFLVQHRPHWHAAWPRHPAQGTGSSTLRLDRHFRTSKRIPHRCPKTARLAHRHRLDFSQSKGRLTDEPRLPC